MASLFPESDWTSNKNYYNPFVTPSQSFIPNNWYDALKFALEVAFQHPTYTNALTRTISHFITDIVFKDNGDYAARESFKEYLTDDLCIYDTLRQAGLEMFIFGNSFLRIHYPFRRTLVDRRRGYTEHDLEPFKEYATYDWKKMTYKVPDPLASGPMETRPKVDLEFTDRKKKNKEGIKLRFIDPQRMMLQMNFISGTTEYIYRFEEFFVAAIKSGNQIHQVNETPMEMLKAIREGKDFKFNDGVIFHFKNPTITGVSNNGWGIPHILLNYSMIHQIQVLRCINEAVGRDYLLPIRLLTPSATSNQGGGDVMNAMNAAMWKNHIGKIIQNKRKNPETIFSVPFPVQYQEAGGTGKNLAPVDLIQYQTKEMLDSAGFAAQLQVLDLTAQQIPTALRMFESTNIFVPRQMNKFVKWVTKEIREYLNETPLTAELLRPTVADDLEKKHVLLQLAAAGDVSRATAYRAFNINDPIAEIERRDREDIAIQRTKEKLNQEFEREMQVGSADQIVQAMMEQQQAAEAPPPGGGGGAPPPPGAPPPMPSGGSQTPLDIAEQADQQAQQLLQMPEADRRKQLATLAATNETLYAMVKKKMEDMRRQGASEGRKQVSAQ